jgi:hypothetical protein
MMGAFRLLIGCSPLIAGADRSYWSDATRTLFSPVFWARMSFTARRRLTPTGFGAWILVGTRLRAPI